MPPERWELYAMEAVRLLTAISAGLGIKAEQINLNDCRLMTPDAREKQKHAYYQWLASDDGRKWLSSPDGEKWLSSGSGGEYLNTPEGGEWLQSPEGMKFKANLANRIFKDAAS